MSLSRKQLKTASIIDAATNNFLAYGYNGATTDLIQKEAGVSKATLYNHFPTKESLFSSVVNKHCKQFIEQVKAIAIPGDNLIASLRKIGEAYLRLLLSKHSLALFRVVVAEAPRFPGLAKNFYEAGPGSLMEVVTTTISQAMDNNELADIQYEPAQLAADYISVLRGKSQMYCLLHPDTPVTDSTVTQWVEETIMLCLRPSV